jgi:hypothetical protein
MTYGDLYNPKASWVIAQKTEVSEHRKHLWRQGGGSWTCIHRENNDDIDGHIRLEGGGQLDIQGFTNYVTGQPTVVAFTYDGDSFKGSANGLLIVNPTSGAGADLLNVNQPLTLGGQNQSNVDYSGEIYEVLYFSYGLSDEERQQVEGYLAWKWGMEGNLVSDHPYLEYAPGDAPEAAAKVSGIVQIDGTPAERTVRAFGYNATPHDIDGEPVTLSKSLGNATSDPADGSYTIDLLAGYSSEIFVVAFDDYGAAFNADKPMSVGDRIHPTTPNGHVFETTGAGDLPTEEPTWVVDTETSQLYGTASMIAVPFYRPVVHGPITPEVTEPDPVA